MTNLVLTLHRETLEQSFHNQYIVYNILALTRYDVLGASSRVRFHGYEEFLCAAGYSVEYRPLLSNSYLISIMNSGNPQIEILRSYYRRLSLRRNIAEFDMIWLEKELWPMIPYIFENSYLPKHVPLVVDYDDAVFHNYDLHRNSVVRKILGQKIDKIMYRADAVCCGSDYLIQRAQDAGAKRIEYLPTVVNIDRHEPKNYLDITHKKNAIIIGWIGTPFTYEYLHTISKPLGEVAREQNIEFHVIGVESGDPIHPGVKTVFHPWSEETETEQIRRFDIGIMPLDDSPFSRGKCAYKLVMFMATAIPVIASGIGANLDVVPDGSAGILVKTDNEWIEALLQLCKSVQIRQKYGECGRDTVMENYTYSANSKVLETLFGELIQDYN